MTPAEYAATCEAVAGRKLGALGAQLGEGMATQLPLREITTPLRLAHFLAQVCHETERFEFMQEQGGPAYFARHYDGRRDLGNTQPGDGFRFHGRGLLQITGRANYATYGAKLGLDLIGDPDLAAEPANAVATAALFWFDHGLNALADLDNIEAITRRINGGLNGIDEREAMLFRAKSYLATLAP